MGRLTEILGHAQMRAKQAGLIYEGALMPAEAAEVLSLAPGSRLIDVRSRVRSMRIGDETTRQRIARAGFVGRVSSIVVEVEMGPDGSAKPSEILEALLGDGEVPHQAIRDALLLEAVTSSKRDSREISPAVAGDSAC